MISLKIDFQISQKSIETPCSAIKRGLPVLTAADMRVISGTFVHFKSLRAVLVISKGNNLLDVDATSDDNRTMPVYLSKPPIFHMQILEIQSYFCKKKSN